MRSARSRVARAVLAIVAGIPLAALTQVPGPLRIGPSWGTLDGANHSASLFTTVINRGVLFDRLAGGSCPGYGDASLAGLDPATQGNRPQDRGLGLPPGTTAQLSPNGPHMVLANAPASLAAGALVPCTLDFVHSGQRIVIFTIGAAPPRTDEP